MPTPRFLIRNYVPLAAWGIMTVWLIFLAVFTWLFIRDGGFHQFSIAVEISILILFWMFGIAGALYVYNVELTKLVVERRSTERGTGISAVATAIKPWSRTVEIIPEESLRSLQIQTDKDSEGCEYFRLVLTTPGGRSYTLREGHDRDTVHATVSQIMDILTATRP